MPPTKCHVLFNDFFEILTTKKIFWWQYITRPLAMFWSINVFIAYNPIESKHQLFLLVISKLKIKADFFFLQEDEKSKVLLLESDNSKLMVSPVRVYHMNNNLKGSVCDENGICRINFTFEWLNPEAVCSSNFVCTALGRFYLHLLVFSFIYQFN